jgi:hypothetical protein
MVAREGVRDGMGDLSAGMVAREGVNIPVGEPERGADSILARCRLERGVGTRNDEDG